ncbi:MAG: peptide-methionine (R)-S-oxide reductase MsrB [Opitutales bacterium]
MKERQEAPDRIEKPASLSEAEWRARLTPEQYRILREAGTERAFGEVYRQFKDQGEGDYYCAGCGTLLFSSMHKFDSHCGWPSFYDPAEIESVELREDRSLGMVRTEVVCANCGGHLGHLFKGEGFDTPKDQRFCINGFVLEFVPKGAAAPSDRAKSSSGGSPTNP